MELPDPELATWLAALGTVGATAVAASALLIATLDKRKTQARLVSVWFDGYLEVENASPAPITNVYVGVLEGRKVLDDTGSASVRPGHRWRARDGAPGGRADELHFGPLEIELRFSDASGIRWRRRWHAGTLKRVRWWHRKRGPG